MSEPEEILRGYLLGELSDAEQAGVEERYFTDPQTFDQLTQLETELIDAYARDRLAPQMRARVERAYLSNPNRRAHLRFSKALATKLDQISASRNAELTKASSWKQKFSALLAGRPRALAFAAVLALLLISAGFVWLLVRNNRARQELARARDAQQQHELAPEQLANQQKTNPESTAEPDNRAPQPATSPAPMPAPLIASLVLTAGDTRGANRNAVPRLAIPKGTAEVRLQLNLRDHDYQDYQLVLQAIGGREIFNRAHVKPSLTKSGATFTVTLPAAKIGDGDYMLTLKGVTAAGETEDVSQSLFRVEKK